MSTTTMKQLARLAGVSQPVVSAVINNRFDNCRVGAAKRKKILSLVAQHGFVPNHAARSLATSKTNVVNVMVPSTAFFQHYNYSTILTGLQEVVEAADYRLTFSSFSQGYRDHRALTGLLADGLVFFYWGGPVQNMLVKNLGQKKIPLVAAYGRCSVPRVNNLFFDTRRALSALTKHLIEKGHRRILCLPTYIGDILHREGLAGIRQAVTATPDCQLRIVPQLPPLRKMVVPRELFEMGRQTAHTLITDPFKPTAVMFNNDDMALGTLAGLKALGMQVPRDMTVTGFDDAPYAILHDPPLTTVDLRPAEYGRQLGELVLRLMAKPATAPAKTAFAITPVFRQSSGL